MSEELVVVKLVDGDQFIGQLLNITENGVLVLRPITIKTQHVITPSGSVERLTTSVYCPLSGDESFLFDISHVLFVNKLNANMCDQYFKLSKELYESLHDPNGFHPPNDDDEPEEVQEQQMSQTKKTTYH